MCHTKYIKNNNQKNKHCFCWGFELTDSLAERETTQTLSLRNKHKTQKRLWFKPLRKANGRKCKPSGFWKYMKINILTEEIRSVYLNKHMDRYYISG